MIARFNPLDVNFKSVIGAVKAKSEVKFSVLTDSDYCAFVIRKDGTDKFLNYPMKREGAYWTFSYKAEETGLFWYCFDLGNGNFLGLGKHYEGELQSYPNSFQLTVYRKDFTVPCWLNGGIIYQIFPDRFNRVGEIKIKKGAKLHENTEDIPDYLPDENGEVKNNDFFGGNLKGITDKLDYLKDLGITAIYLNPVFEAYSNHRYDTGDYMKIDGLLGGEEDLKELIEKAEERGIKIILDGVFNHTGSDSVYFNKNGTYDSLGAYQSKKSPYYKWYKFNEYPDDYESWWGIKTLPAVNENEKSYIEFITGKNGVIEKYAAMGIGGFRLDVADELPDEFIKKIRKTLKGVNENAILIGEVWEDATNKISYGRRRTYFLGEELDCVMNYTLKDAIVKFVKDKNARAFSYTVKEAKDHYPKEVFNINMNILSTHDTKRILTALSNAPDVFSKAEKAAFHLSGKEKKEAVLRLKTASLLQYTLNGVPSLYYGDEAGMEGFEDPFNRLYYPWGKEDKEIFSWYKLLGKIRREHGVFKDGDYKELYVDRNFLCFERRNEEEVVAVAVNLGESEYTLNFNGVMKDLIKEKNYENGVKIPPNSVKIFSSNV